MENVEVNRTPRASKTQAKTERRKPWSPPSLLDAPPPPEGFVHRWELVRKDEYPDFEAPTVDNGRYEGVFGVGGLLLARIPVEIVEERSQYFKSMSEDAMKAVDNDLLKETQHHSMAIQKPERQSRVTFGGPKGEK